MAKKKNKPKKSKGVSPEEFLKNLNTLDLLDGNLTDNDALALMKLAKESVENKKDSVTFLDLGCWKGKSTSCLAVIASKFLNGKVYAVDHFKGIVGTKDEQIAKTTDIHNIFKNNMKEINAWDKIICLMEMSLEEAFIILKDRSFDLVFVDMDNSYMKYRSHIDYALNLVKDNGIICGRNLIADYLEVKELVDENIGKEYLMESKMHPGIIKAVFETFGNDYHRVENSSLWWWRK